MQITEKDIEINAPVERVFDLFSDFESFPRWMSHIKEVRYTGRRYTRWTAEAPLGTSVEWEAETTHFEPDHRIAWRSVRGDVETEGEVVFQETARGTTLMRVMLGYDPPAGRLGALVARLFGTNPEQQLDEDLERFAEVAEGRQQQRGRSRRTGRDFDQDRRLRARHEDEPRRYDRDERARRGRDAYGEEADERARRFGTDRMHDGRRDWEERGRRSEPGRYMEDRSPRAHRRDFDDEVRAALRSQRESMRRYDEERERDERERRSSGYDREDERRYARPARGPADERRLYERRMREDERRRREGPARRGEDGPRYAAPPPPPPPPPPRHALTPRERELERTRGRRPDFDYSKKAFSRGVDKLMDEDDAPSNRWRRW